MILHTLNAAPNSAAYRDCLQIIRKEDALLLLGDGVYCALSGTECCSDIKVTDVDVFVLEPHATAAGILGKMDETFSPVNFDQFAALSERFSRQLDWF